MAERLSGIFWKEFENSFCKFTPFDWKDVDGVLRPVIFKVVTSDFHSLGLRHNPTILEFPVGEWVRLPEDELLATNKDKGGIWCALKLSGARTLTKYMFEEKGILTRTFLTAVDTPLYSNSYRVKSKGVVLLQEIIL